MLSAAATQSGLIGHSFNRRTGCLLRRPFVWAAMVRGLTWLVKQSDALRFKQGLDQMLPIIVTSYADLIV